MNRKSFYILGISLLYIFTLFSLSFSQEQLTITTYYPSPHGVYKTLRIHPSPAADCPSGVVCANIGEMCYNDGTGVDPAGLYICDNSLTWQAVVGAGGVAGWSLTGNAGTNPANNFIGTTDAFDWVVRTANTERMLVSSAGNVGIGTLTPLSILHVDSLTSGFIPPRMDTVERDSIGGGAPPRGSIIYNDDTNNLEYYDGTAWQTVGATAASFRGALYNVEPVSINSGVGGQRIEGAINFTMVYDPEGIFDSNWRFIVPAGVSKVRVSAYGTWVSNSTGGRAIAIKRYNSSDVETGVSARDVRPAVYWSDATISTPVMEVIPGERFGLHVIQITAPVASLDFSGWINVEIIE